MLAVADLMKLKWYLNRLRSMEPAEVRHRAHEAVLKTISRHSKTGWYNYPASNLSVVFPSLRQRITRSSPEQRQAIADAAATTLSGRFSALGLSWPERDPEALYSEDLWRFDPVTGATWPGAEAFTFDIGYRHASGRGDIKYVWEIARLQTLPPLAAHAALTGDISAVAAIEAAISSWHAANPPFRGTGWASGIEVALRAISLILTHDLVSERLSRECRTYIGEILSASDYWLKRFPSKFSSANNHLIAELSGEYLIGLAVGRPAGGVAEQMKAESLKQFLPDGCGAEQSPTYGAFSAEFLLLCMLAARDHGETFGSATEGRLAAFADFVEWLPDRAGFGDDDEGRVITLGNETDYARSVVSAIRGFLNQDGSVPDKGDFRSLLFGRPVGEIGQRSGLRVFPDGGLSIWRGEMAGKRVDLVFDHGPLGYLSIAAHGHADALAVSLCLDGEPLLVDPGTWLYGSGGIWRNWFRSTPAHNTLNIDGESQSVMSGAFNWSHKATVRLIGTTPEPDWSITAQHDGYQKRFGAVHQRSLRFENDAIVVMDRLVGASRDAELVFQLAADLAADVAGATVTVSRKGERLIKIEFPAGQIVVKGGGDGPGEGGWVSQCFGVRVPAPRVAWRGHVGNDGIKTIIRVAEGIQYGEP